MAFPANVLSLAHAIGSQLTRLAFGGSVPMSTGLNSIIDDVAAAETKIGISESSAQDSPLANTVLASSTNTKSKWRQILNGDITAGTILDAAINASAAIAVTKLAAGAANTVLIGGASNSFSTGPTVGSITSLGAATANSVNSNTSGAAAGEVKALLHVKAGGSLYAGGQVNYGQNTSSAVSVAQSATTLVTSAVNIAGLIWLYDNATGDMLVTICQSGLGVNATPIKNSGTNFDGSGTDAGAVWSFYRDAGTGAFTIKNRRAAGGARTVSWFLMGG